MSALLAGVFSVALVFTVYVVGIAMAVWAGSYAYVSWRLMKRADLRADNPIAALFLGDYESPFPWHRSAE